MRFDIVFGFFFTHFMCFKFLKQSIHLHTVNFHDETTCKTCYDSIVLFRPLKRYLIGD